MTEQRSVGDLVKRLRGSFGHLKGRDRKLMVEAATALVDLSMQLHEAKGGFQRAESREICAVCRGVDGQHIAAMHESRAAVAE